MTEKIDSLTPEQEALIPVVRDEWTKRALSKATLNREGVIEGLNWMYGLADKPLPQYVFVNSPLAAQVAANILSEVSGSVDLEEVSRVSSQLARRLMIPKEKRDKLSLPGVSETVTKAVDALVAAKNLYHFRWLGWSGVWLFGWAAFVDFFDRTGLVKNEHFPTWKKLLESGSWDSIVLDNGYCICCEYPEYLHLDTESRLSCDTGPSCEWSDGFKLYFIRGVNFKEELFYQITRNELTAKEILGLDNVEQRMIALKYRGPEKLLEELDAKLTDTGRGGVELFEIDNVFSTKAKYLKYTCPSTGRVYVSGVDPTLPDSADACMAWKRSMSVEDYRSASLENES